MNCVLHALPFLQDVYKSGEQIKAAGGKITREPGPLPGVLPAAVACTPDVPMHASCSFLHIQRSSSAAVTVRRWGKELKSLYMCAARPGHQDPGHGGPRRLEVRAGGQRRLPEGAEGGRRGLIWHLNCRERQWRACMQELQLQRGSAAEVLPESWACKYCRGGSTRNERGIEPLP
jgi:hypothetical protein